MNYLASDLQLIYLLHMFSLQVPIYWTQWHPEKNIFKWSTSEGMNHGPHAVSTAQATANFFVNEGEAFVRTYLCV